MTAFRTLDQADVKGKRVLVRVDLNVPMADGKVADDTRIRAVAPTITEIAEKGGKVILLAHFGRPKGGPEAAFSLRQVVPALVAVLDRPVAFVEDCIGPAAEAAVAAMKDGDVLLLENTRFHKAEEKNEPEFVAALAKLGDLYVNDAFSAAHRAHASTEGLAHKLPAYAGRSMQREIEAIESALANPKRPVVAVIGGAKVSSKIDVLENLVGKVDALVVGGGMANTFLLAKGIAVGKSLAEPDLVDTAQEDHGRGRQGRVGDRAADRRRGGEGIQGRRRGDRRAGRRGARRPDDPRHRPEVDRGGQRLDRQGGDAGLERPARRLRGAALRQGDDVRGAPRRVAEGQGAVGRRRRRDGVGASPGRRGRRLQLHLDRRRGLPRMARGQGAAGRRGAAGVGSSNLRQSEAPADAYAVKPVPDSAANAAASQSADPVKLARRGMPRQSRVVRGGRCDADLEAFLDAALADLESASDGNPPPPRL